MSVLATESLIGQRFGHWEVIAFSGSNAAKERLWLSRCVCGNERPIRGHHLRKGLSKSCGCQRNSARKKAVVKPAGTPKAFPGAYRNGTPCRPADPPVDQPSLRAALRRKAEALRPKVDPRTAPLRPSHCASDALARAMMILSDRRPEPSSLLDLRFALERARLDEQADEVYRLYQDWERAPGFDPTSALNAVRRFLVEVTG